MRSRLPLAPVFALLATLAACLMPASAWALVAPMDFSALSKASDSVVVATVVSASARYADSSSPFKGLIVTDTKFKVTDVADGARGQTVTVTQPGGAVGDIGLKVDNYPQFSAGETCVLFLDRQNRVIGGHQGKLDVSRDRVPEYGISTGELGDKVRGARRGQKVPRRPRQLSGAPSSSTGQLTARSPVASAVQGAVSVSTAAAPSVIIASVAPTKAIAGVDYVTITGSGFGATQGTGGVAFNNGLRTSGGMLAATNIASWSDTSIVCQVPQNAASGPMYVLNSANSLASYTYDTSFSTAGFTWGTMPATFRINEGAPTMTGEAAQIEAAMMSWNAVTENFKLAYSPAPVAAGAYPPTGTDGVNSIQFVSLASAPGALAMTATWYYTSTLKFIECDMYFDSARTWGSTASAGVYDLQTVALHELGHTAGLDDQYPNTWRVMGAYSGANRRMLSADEIAGINYLYGANPPVTLPTIPTVSSASHPIQTQWYASTTAEFTFSSTSPEGIKGYAFLLDESQNTDPDPTVTAVATTATFPGLAPGEHYFHVRAISTLDRVGPTAHFRVRIGDAPPPVVYRFLNRQYGTHFYTADEAEYTDVNNNKKAEFTYEGISYIVAPKDTAGATPVHRFLSKRYAYVHFYTANDAEYQNVLNNMKADWTYEGVSYAVWKDPGGTLVPVNRFLNKTYGVHFYTSTASEYDRALAMPTYQLEGIGFYAEPFVAP